MKNTTNNIKQYSADCNRTTSSKEKAQVLVVLSDNGIEEIPLVGLAAKENEPPLSINEEARDMRKARIARNHSLPANLKQAQGLSKPSGLMDYLQVPNNSQLIRRLSASSIVSKSSLSSFGIYSAPETPTSLNSPSPSNISPCSADIHQKFTFPEPQNSHDFDVNTFVLGNFQHLSKSADAIQTEDNIDDSAHLKWADTRSTSAIKDETTTKRKKSILERIGSNMSDRSLISRRIRRSLTNWSSAQSSKDQFGDSTINFPKTKRSSIRQKYRIVAAKTGQSDGISFESIDKPGFFLRAKGRFLEPERDGSDAFFNKDSTFVPLPDMWFAGFFAFESVGKPSFFIRLNQLDELTIDRYDGTSAFKEDASFKLTKKPCTTCLQVGVKGWVKMTFGGFCIGKVTAVNDCVEVSFDDGKLVKVPKSSQGCLIPDVVPRKEELSIGARVISQWLDRDFLYPGIITGAKGNEYEIQFDDGDKGKCQAYQIRLVRDHLFQDHSCNSPSYNRVGKQDAPLITKSLSFKDDERSQTSAFQTKRQQFSKKRLGKLWSRDTTDPDAHNGKEVISQKDSLSSNDSQDLVTNSQSVHLAEKKPIRVVMKNLQTPVFETETMSQDSGYHGYLRQKNIGKGYEDQCKTLNIVK